MRMSLTTNHPYEFSIGEVFEVGTLEKLDFNVGVFYNEDKDKYEPITPKKNGENVTFRVLKGYFTDKYKCRYMQMMSDHEPSVIELQEHLITAFNRFIEMRKYSLSNHLCLTLNYFDPLYNYDRMEIFDENHTTTYNGTETDTTTYNGTEKDTLSKKGYEQRGTNGYDATQEIGKTIDTNEVTGFNKPTEFSNESRTTSTFGNDGTLPGKEVTVTGSEGNYHLEMSGSGTLGGRTTKDTHEVIETTAYNNRTDTTEKSFIERNDELVKSFEDRNDVMTHTSNNHLYGNIGVTTSSALLLETYKLGEIYNFTEKVIEEFIEQYTFIM